MTPQAFQGESQLIEFGALCRFHPADAIFLQLDLALTAFRP